MENRHNSKMMWGMMAGCLVLLVLFLLFGKNLGGNVGWLLFVFLAVCFGTHILMMFGHKDHDKDEHDHE